MTFWVKGIDIDFFSGVGRVTVIPNDGSAVPPITVTLGQDFPTIDALFTGAIEAVVADPGLAPFDAIHKLLLDAIALHPEVVGA